jgi:hypothetical protein
MLKHSEFRDDPTQTGAEITLFSYNVSGRIDQPTKEYIITHEKIKGERKFFLGSQAGQGILR